MALINLTPHVINVGDLVIHPSGQVARVTSVTKVVDVVEGVEIIETYFGEVDYGGPCWRQSGTYYIVSALVRLAAKDRQDLLSPGEQIRNAAGQVIGCKNLTR